MQFFLPGKPMSKTILSVSRGGGYAGTASSSLGGGGDAYKDRFYSRWALRMILLKISCEAIVR